MFTTAGAITLAAMAVITLGVVVVLTKVATIKIAGQATVMAPTSE